MGKRYINGIFAGLGLLLLILDSKTALIAGQSAADLCLQSIIPSIFPFLVLSSMLTTAIRVSALPIWRPIGRVMGISPGSVGIFLTGILSGYPVGAKAVSDEWENGHISKAEAERMLAFSSNAGPAFLFGILINSFPNRWMLWQLWGIHILSAILVAFIIPSSDSKSHILQKQSELTWRESMLQAVKTMGYICGWIVLFRIILTFLDRWILWIVPAEGRVAIHGLVELANGCLSLSTIDSVGLRFILCSGMLAFGGLCVGLQTASVIGNLNIKNYYLGKILQTVFSLWFSAMAQQICFHSQYSVSLHPLFYAIPVGISVLFWFVLRKKQNNSSNFAQIGV